MHWPNEVCSVDFKGEFRTCDRQLCYPLTVADHHSRLLVACSGRRSIDRIEAIPVFEEAGDMERGWIGARSLCLTGNAGLTRVERVVIP